MLLLVISFFFFFGLQQNSEGSSKLVCLLPSAVREGCKRGSGASTVSQLFAELFLVRKGSEEGSDFC